MIEIICARLAREDGDDGAYMHFVHYLQLVEALIGTTGGPYRV